MSDIRLKTNISPIPNALDKLLQLNGILYTWKDPSKTQDRQMGVIAQDVQKVFPEAVHADEQGILSVNYYMLIAPIIEGMKELKAENALLKAALEAKK